MDKVSYYREVSRQAAKELCRDWKAWAAFLETSSRFSRYPYTDQLLIYAQRPDATACADYDMWKKLHRYVQKGAKGIALLDDTGGSPKLHYVFDIADTGEGKGAVSLRFWNITNSEYEARVARELDQLYGNLYPKDLPSSLSALARRLTGNNLERHWEEVEALYGKEPDSVLTSLVENSVCYQLLYRSGFSAGELFGEAELGTVREMTPESLNAAGNLTQYVSEEVFSHIRRITRKIEETERRDGAERSKNGSDIQEGGRRPPAEYRAERGSAHKAAGKIWADEKEVSEGTSSADLQPDASGRDIVSAPVRDRRDGAAETGRNNAQAGKGSGGNGGTEAQGYDAVGRPDEQLQVAGGGNHSAGADLHVTSYEQISLFSEVERPAEENGIGQKAGEDTSAFAHLKGEIQNHEEAESHLPAEQEHKEEIPDLSGLPVLRTDHTIRIGSDETVHEIEITVTDEEWQAIREAIPESTREQESISVLEHKVPAANFHITDDTLGEGGPKEKFRANLKAIKILQDIERGRRTATEEEQEALSHYVGWGGLADAFDPTKENWRAEYAELKELLTTAEYDAARASTLNAHYTSPTVIRAIYEAVEKMGFTAGNILEPSCGVGNFFGMLPKEMSASRLYGVELDSISGRIAKQLYPQADIIVAGFETTDRRDFYDLAVGNVPFGHYQVNDRAYNRLGFSIHNYFFAKALDQVRPGGIIAFVTSRYTMDAKDPKVRKYLAQRAELLGAIRLPNDAFRANAGTNVVSDLIFLQKRERPVDAEPDWVHLGQNVDGFAINSYFVEHPEMILGRLTLENTQYGKQDFTIEPIPGMKLSDQLHDAVKQIRGTYYREAESSDRETDEKSSESIPADPDVRNYSYTEIDGNIYFRENSRMVRQNVNAATKARVKGMAALRDCVHQLIDLQMDEYTPDSVIQEKQGELNRLYDEFSARYGLINDRGNRLAFSDDSSYYLLCALEVLDEDGKLERKADMFTKRTIKPHKAVTMVDTASEALTVSIAEKARVDMEYMSKLTGKSTEKIASELSGVIFKDPAYGSDPLSGWQTADEYLSGNVRQKLRAAQRAAERDPAFAVNVEALKTAQPKDLDASDIEVRLGATWIDKDYIRQFMYETFDTPWYMRRSIDVNYAAFTAEWHISGKNSIAYNNIAAYTTYGTSRANAYRILEDSLNLRDVRIYDTVEDADGRERRVLNVKETTLAAQKQQIIREAFKDWIWKDPDRRRTLVRQYNEEMNSIRPREYDGSHIVFSGMNPEITLRDHQKNVIAHVIYGGNTLLAHEVGAGKTFEMVAAAMESKRLGLCQKSIFVVPNHLTEQWASEFLRLYPSANILVATKKDFETRNRKKFCARIATGEYDAVIIGHSQFERIPISKERQERLLREQIEEITEGITEVELNGGEHFTVKQLERTKRGLEARLEKLQADHRKDDVVTFEQLGVDRMFVDEAHNYKNMFLYTKMRNVAGLSTSDAQKSSDMFAKCRYLDEVTGSRGVVFATGTPVSNSMTELYTMQRYLQYERLQELGMVHFDCWASRFGETVTALELAPEGTGYRARTRFSKFFNLPELMNLFKEAADIKTADQLHLPTPKVEYHTVVTKPTEHQQKMVQALAKRAALVHSGNIDPSVDNMLKITSDGRKLGLDQRILSPLLPDEAGTKVNLCVENILQIWRDGQADKLTQLVFCDISTPKATPSRKVAKAASGNLDSPEIHALEAAIPLPEPEPAFTVYEDIRQKLITQGVPEEQIAFIHEANTEVRKKELFAKVRTGQVRVLIGSTSKMGAGTNVQDRLVALHDLDCPWRPGDLAQRKGRIERQGNQNPLVHVFRYVTEGTFDAYLWQTVENKQKFISQIMTSKSPVRSCDDVDETALSFAEIKALCAGDPRIKERMDLDVEVSRLKLMKADHQSKKFSLEDNLLKYFPEQIEQNKGYIRGLQADMQTLAAHTHPKDSFAGMEIQGNLYSDRENAGAALLDACKEVKSFESVQIGKYRGFSMELSFQTIERQYELTLHGEMSHKVVLGMDPRGNLIRIENTLAQMPQRLEEVQMQLDNLYQQQAAAKVEAGKPFRYEQELQEKTARLIELNSALNMEPDVIEDNIASAPKTEAADKHVSERKRNVSASQEAAERVKRLQGKNDLRETEEDYDWEKEF